jgi:hypothetical protein
MHKIIEYVDDTAAEPQSESWQSKRIEQYVSIDTASGPVLVRSSVIDDAARYPVSGNSPDVHNEQKLYQRQQADKEFQNFRETVNESVKTVPTVLSEQTITDLRVPIYSNIAVDDIPTTLHIKCLSVNDALGSEPLFDWCNQTYVHLESMPTELRDVIKAYTRLLLMSTQPLATATVDGKNFDFEKLKVTIDTLYHSLHNTLQELRSTRSVEELTTLDEIYEQCGVR